MEEARWCSDATVKSRPMTRARCAGWAPALSIGAVRRRGGAARALPVRGRCGHGRALRVHRVRRRRWRAGVEVAAAGATARAGGPVVGGHRHGRLHVPADAARAVPPPARRRVGLSTVGSSTITSRTSSTRDGSSHWHSCSSPWRSWSATPGWSSGTAVGSAWSAEATHQRGDDAGLVGVTGSIRQLEPFVARPQRRLGRLERRQIGQLGGPADCAELADDRHHE